MQRKWLIGAGAVVAIAIAGSVAFRAGQPNNLGLRDGKLSDCPRSPNCVSTQHSGAYAQATPIPFSGTAADAVAKLVSIINAQPRSTIVTQTDDYIHAEFRSRIFRFVDDVEFYIDESAATIHFRSASRVGQSDLGVNQKRMDQLRAAFLNG